MNRMDSEQRLDALLQGYFRAGPDTELPLGFTNRVMAHVAERQRGTVFSRMFWRVAKPLLVSGWAAAAALAFVAVRGGATAQHGTDWLVAGGSLLNYFTL